MTDDQILDRMAQMIRVGFVNARQPEKMRVKVTLKDTTGAELVTDWLPVLCPRACSDMQYDLPDVGDQVLCLFLAYGLEQGFVIGSMYGKQKPPVQSADKWHRTFSDGAVIEYDRASHALNALIPGTATIKCEGPLKMEAPIIYARGTFVNTAKDGSPGKSVFSGGMEIMDGGINVPDADVVAGGVSLASHTTEGVQRGQGVSSHPSGGSSTSPGTAAIPAGSMAGADLAASIAAKLANLDEDVRKRGDDTDKLILCLPQIANAMAEKEDNEADRQGWIYLHDMFEKWLSAISNDKADTCIEPFYVDWDWIVKFNRAYQAYGEIINNKYLFSQNAQKLLAKRLERDGKLTDKRESFDYIYRSWRNWPDDYFQSKRVPSQLIPWTPDGLMAAMGAFMIYALAKGYAEPAGSGHKIVVEGVALVALDRFNFQGDQSYRYWNCGDLDFSMLPGSGYLELTNEHFRQFRKCFGRGGDFAVISVPHMLENFQGASYVYP